MMLDYSLYVITRRGLSMSRPLAELVAEVLEGGATVIQYRDRGTDFYPMMEQAQQLQALTKVAEVPLIVGGRVDLALAIGADGVHLGLGDMPLEIARRLLGANTTIGVTVRTPEEAREAESEGASYLGASGNWDERSRDRENLKAIAEEVSIPVIAVGGIGPENTKALIQQGAAGVAVMSAVFSAREIRKACRDLWNAIEAGRAATVDPH